MYFEFAGDVLDMEAFMHLVEHYCLTWAVVDEEVLTGGASGAATANSSSNRTLRRSFSSVGPRSSQSHSDSYGMLGLSRRPSKKPTSFSNGSASARRGRPTSRSSRNGRPSSKSSTRSARGLKRSRSQTERSSMSSHSISGAASSSATAVAEAAAAATKAATGKLRLTKSSRKGSGGSQERGRSSPRTSQPSPGRSPRRPRRRSTKEAAHQSPSPPPPPPPPPVVRTSPHLRMRSNSHSSPTSRKLEDRKTMAPRKGAPFTGSSAVGSRMGRGAFGRLQGKTASGSQSASHRRVRSRPLGAIGEGEIHDSSGMGAAMRRHAKLVMRENSFEKVQALLGNATQEVEELRESMGSLKKEILLEITNSLASPVRVVDGWLVGWRVG